MVGTRRILWILTAGLSLAVAAAAGDKGDVRGVAEGYVKLVLEVGLYEPGYVDAYFGPAAWKPSPAEKEESFPAERLAGRADALIEQLKGMDAAGGADLEGQRPAFLKKQLLAVRAGIDLISGKKMSFDEEAKALYDVVVPSFEEADFAGILKKLDETLPGAAENLIRFIEQYRSYIVNYTVGRRLVDAYIEKHCGADKGPERRWQLFCELLSTPQTPSGLLDAK